jgi:hypothetical protein
MANLCSYIRSIALATPELWSFIDDRMLAELITLHLSRAKDIPLTMHFVNPITKRAHAAIPHLSRAKDLRMPVVHAGHFPSLMEGVFLDSFANLTTLHVSRIKGETDLHAMIRLGPRLKELYLRQSVIDCWPEDGAIWPHMRHFRVEETNVHLGALLVLLSRMQNLETFAVIAGYMDIRVKGLLQTNAGSEPSLIAMRSIILSIQPAAALLLMQNIYEMRHFTHDISLDINPQPSRTSRIEDISLIEPFMERWNSISTMSPRSAIILVDGHDLHFSELMAQIVVINEAGLESTLHVAYLPESNSLYQQHKITFSSLEVYQKSPDMEELELILAANAPHLRRLTFHGLSRARAARAWLKGGPSKTSYIEEVQFFNCKEGKSDDEIERQREVSNALRKELQSRLGEEEEEEEEEVEEDWD